MALSMDEQRMLDEIERRLAAEDPGLASNLTSFRKPSRVSVLRSTRARVIGSLFTVIVVAMVSLMVYAMLPFRSGGRAASHHPVTTASTTSGPGQAKIGAAPDTSAAAKASSGQAARASSNSSASGRASASGRTHTSSAAAAAQSGTGASGAVHGP